MKNFPFSIFNIISVFSIILLIVLILVPFNLINLEQAERIAKWKAEYEKLKYSFELVNLHEGSIIPEQNELEKVITDEFILDRILPYMNIVDKQPVKIKRYKYRKMNGHFVDKASQFYFSEFYRTKDNGIVSFNKSQAHVENDRLPSYYLFVDINGENKPNRIGQDIFFLSLYEHHVEALGQGKTHARQKADCSALGRGLYCSEYYLLGGSF